MHISVMALFARALANCTTPDSALDLWYRPSAHNWDQALPVGNVRLAAIVLGDAKREHFQLNEDSIWGGTRHDRANPGTSEAFRRFAG